VPFAQAAANVVKGGARTIRMAPGAPAIVTAPARAIETGADLAYRGLRGLEMVGDMGLEPAMDIIARGARRGGITAPTHSTRRQMAQEEAEYAIDTTVAQERRRPQPGTTPDGQPIGPDEGGPPSVAD